MRRGGDAFSEDVVSSSLLFCRQRNKNVKRFRRNVLYYSCATLLATITGLLYCCYPKNSSNTYRVSHKKEQQTRCIMKFKNSPNPVPDSVSTALMTKKYNNLVLGHPVSCTHSPGASPLRHASEQSPPLPWLLEPNCFCLLLLLASCCPLPPAPKKIHPPTPTILFSCLV